MAYWLLYWKVILLDMVDDFKIFQTEQKILTLRLALDKIDLFLKTIIHKKKM